jgi:serine/threonine protein kinase
VNKIKIDKEYIENLKPLKKNFKNKNNKFSAQGYIKDLKVKIYQTFDSGQGKLREYISNQKNLSNFFPNLICYNDNYIVEEWIDGKTLRQINSKNIKKIPQTNGVLEIIKLMWSTKYTIQVFDYINYIHNRINKINNIDLKRIPLKINHNDLTLDNILLKNDQLIIVDNEFLGCNSGWIFNIINSFIEPKFEYGEFISRENFKKIWNIRKEWSLKYIR